MDERIAALYAVNAGMEPRVDDVCIVDTRTMTLFGGGVIFRRAAGQRKCQELTDAVGRPCFSAVTAIDCGRYTQRASRVVRGQ